MRAVSFFPVFFNLCQPGIISWPVGKGNLLAPDIKQNNLKISSAHMLLYSACSGTETDQSCGADRIIERNSVAALLKLTIIRLCEYRNAYSRSMLVTHSLLHLRRLSIDPAFSLDSSGETVQQFQVFTISAAEHPDNTYRPATLFRH